MNKQFKKFLLIALVFSANALLASDVVITAPVVSEVSEVPAITAPVVEAPKSGYFATCKALVVDKATKVKGLVVANPYKTAALTLVVVAAVVATVAAVKHFSFSADSDEEPADDFEVAQ